jgi:hypothetical protein
VDVAENFHRLFAEEMVQRTRFRSVVSLRSFLAWDPLNVLPTEIWLEILNKVQLVQSLNMRSWDDVQQRRVLKQVCHEWNGYYESAKVRHLDIQACDLNQLHQWPGVKSLSLNWDPSMKLSFGFIPKLKSFAFNLNQDCRFQPQFNILHRHALVKLASMLSFILHDQDGLEVLDLPYCFLPLIDLKSLSSLQHINLRIHVETDIMPHMNLELKGLHKLPPCNINILIDTLPWESFSCNLPDHQHQ